MSGVPSMMHRHRPGLMPWPLGPPGPDAHSTWPCATPARWDAIGFWWALPGEPGVPSPWPCITPAWRIASTSQGSSGTASTQGGSKYAGSPGRRASQRPVAVAGARSTELPPSAGRAWRPRARRIAAQLGDHTAALFQPGGRRTRRGSGGRWPGQRRALSLYSGTSTQPRWA